MILCGILFLLLIGGTIVADIWIQFIEPKTKELSLCKKIFKTTIIALETFLVIVCAYYLVQLIIAAFK